jgi:hypothetical protein
MRWRSYILHVAVGVMGATILCWLVTLALGMAQVPHAEAYVFGPTFAVPVLLGLLTGAFAALQSQDGLSRWVLVPFSVWLSWGLLDSVGVRGGTVKQALATYFGTHCGGSDCLGQFLVTTPFVVSAGYSLGANLYFLLSRR